MKLERTTYQRARAVATLATVVAAIVIAVGFVEGVPQDNIGRSHAMTQVVSSLYSNDDVLDFCYRVALLPGVTGTSVVQFDEGAATATIVIYYEPSVVTSTQLRVFMKNNRIFFTSERKA